MKALVKCKKGICLVHSSGQHYLDEYRFRVVPYDLEISRWESRSLVEVKTSSLKDEASDPEFKALFSEKGDKAIIEFISKYSSTGKSQTERKTEEKPKKEQPKAEEQPKEEQAKVEEQSVEVKATKKEVSSRKEYVKSYKKRR